VSRVGADRSRERGANLVELAVVMTLLLVLLAGAADVGRAFYSYIVIINASREGARFASHFPHLPDEIRLVTKQDATGSGVILQDDDILIDPEGGAPPHAGEPIRVSVEYDFPTILSGMLGVDIITLRSSTQMVVFGLEE